MFYLMPRCVLICILFLCGNANALNYYSVCKEANPSGDSQCRLKPDIITEWSYSVHPNNSTSPSSPTHTTPEEAVVAWVNRQVGGQATCHKSYSVSDSATSMFDRFAESKMPVLKRADLTLVVGYPHPENGCQTQTIVATVYSARSITCDNRIYSNVSTVFFDDINSSACRVKIASDSEQTEENQCNALGNPVLISTKEKLESIQDIFIGGPMPLEFVRKYRSNRARDHGIWFAYGANQVGSIGNGWLHNHEISLSVVQSVEGVSAPTGSIRVQMPDGSFSYFHRRAGETAYVAMNGQMALNKLTGSTAAWSMSDSRNGISYIFDSNGKIIQQIHSNGWQLNYTYNAEKLSSVENQFGKKLIFAYALDGKLTSVTTSDLRSVNFVYVDGMLKGVQQADGSSVQYKYTIANNIYPLLSGKVDEYGVDYATFTYQQKGSIFSTEKAGGVEKYMVVTDKMVRSPHGTYHAVDHRTYGSEVVFGGASPPIPNGSPPINSATFGMNGLINSSLDQKGQRTTYTWDVIRRLPLSVTYGSGTPEARTVTTTWHNQWRLPLTISEQGRTTTYTYDSGGNPLTRTVSDSGVSGISRVTSWTYNATGLVATETAPNGAVTTYSYDSYGNIAQSTNALGHISAYSYDAAGRVLTHTAPNGLLTSYMYDVRGRVLTSVRGGLSTSFTYRPSGELLTSSHPNGQIISYAYDAAHRLIGWSDNRGDRGEYSLDSMGNRLHEQIYKGSQIHWQTSRLINGLNQMTSYGVGLEAVKYTYDPNGDVASITNGMSETDRYVWDPHRRMKTFTDAENAVASMNYNALDGLIASTDANNVVTSYSRDAVGNATSESSSDVGSQSAQYDALGLPSTIVDALGQSTSITRDLLGRPTLIGFSGGVTTTLRYDLPGGAYNATGQPNAGKGYLSEIEDSSGTTSYQRDEHGRVIRKTQKLINNDSKIISYGYSSQTGLIAEVVYPGGQALQYFYNATGQISALSWAGQPLITGLTWNPLGQPLEWSWSLPGASSPISGSRTYDLLGRVVFVDSGNFIRAEYDYAGRIKNLKHYFWFPTSDLQTDDVMQYGRNWQISYDKAGKITSFASEIPLENPQSVSFTYDANGNRTGSTQKRAGITTTRTYQLAGNRQLGLAQTKVSAEGTANANISYQYNAAGDLLSDGLRTYRYDTQGRLERITIGEGIDAPSVNYAHNALGQRVFKTEPLYSGSGFSSSSSMNLLKDSENSPKEEPRLIQKIYQFFTRLWSPGSTDAEKLGFSYVYGEDGVLIGEYGMGGSSSTGITQYIYLPVGNGSMPIAAVINGTIYAIHSDHLNTPRKLTQADGRVAWQWPFSPFGDEKPTLGSQRYTSETTFPTTGSTSIPEVAFNLRYPGQYFDKESGLHYNYFRSYSPERGRYTQADPIGLDGGFNRFGYVGGDPMSQSDPTGLCPVCPAFVALGELALLVHSAAMEAVPMPVGGGLSPTAAAARMTVARAGATNVAKEAEMCFAEGAFSLVGANRAVIDSRKITEYALNISHPVGANKARVFESALGMTVSHADDLILQLRQGVMNNTATAGKVDQFGARYTVDIPVGGPAGNAVVRSGWIYKPGSDTPNLTTIFVK